MMLARHNCYFDFLLTATQKTQFDLSLFYNLQNPLLLYG